MSGSDQPKRAESHLKPRVLSHGTVECHDLDAAWERACAEKDAYGIRKITRPVDQHGTYSFYVIDADGNWWEILTNPPGGYG